MKKILIALIVMASGLGAFAQEQWGKGGGISYSMAGIEGGFRWNSAEQESTLNKSNKQVIGFQLGGSAVFDLTENFGIKTGLFYTERPFKTTYDAVATTPAFDVTGKVTYFDIPVFAMLKLEDYAGVYIGPSFGIKLSDETSTTLVVGSTGAATYKGTIVPITIGAQFKLTPSMGINLFFESAGELGTGLTASRAVGANLLFTFD